MPSADPLPILADPALLRRFAVNDLHAFQSYRHDPDLGRYQGWSPLTDSEALVFIEEMRVGAILQPGEWSQIAIADPGTDELIGDLGLFLAPDASYAEVGFTLSRAAQGRGVATAAVRATIDMVFGYTPARRVFGITDTRNTASVRVLERAGMQRLESREVVFKGEACTEWIFIKDR